MAHDFEWGGAVEPDFEGEGTLVEEHGEAVGAACACGGGFFDQSRGASGIHGVIDKQVGSEKRWGDDRGVEAAHAEGGGIDEDVGVFQFALECGLLEGDGGEAFDGAAEVLGLEKGLEFFFERLDFFQ